MWVEYIARSNWPDRGGHYSKDNIGTKNAQITQFQRNSLNKSCEWNIFHHIKIHLEKITEAESLIKSP